MRGSLDYLRTHAPYGKDVHIYVGQGNAVEGAFHAAKQIADSDTINGLIDIVRAETEADLLGQADTLLDAKAVAAAAVIAGGALETYLSSLIGRLAIPSQQHGDRGVSTYNNAIASYRRKNPNLPLYSAATGDQISGWAKMRNDAAHDPLRFSKDYSAERVRQMIDGIRSLIGGKS